MTDLFVDASTFLLAVGGPHPDRVDCREFLRQAADRNVVLHASVEAVQEFVFHRMRRTDRATAIAQSRALVGSVVLHAFDEDVLTESLHLIHTSTLRGRDAVHAATARLAGYRSIVSLDTDFDAHDVIERLHPSTLI